MAFVLEISKNMHLWVQNTNGAECTEGWEHVHSRCHLRSFPWRSEAVLQALRWDRVPNLSALQQCASIIKHMLEFIFEMWYCLFLSVYALKAHKWSAALWSRLLKHSVQLKMTARYHRRGSPQDSRDQNYQCAELHLAFPNEGDKVTRRWSVPPVCALAWFWTHGALRKLHLLQICCLAQHQTSRSSGPELSAWAFIPQL